MGWKVIDELMQVRGGRGYETAESLKARGEKPVPVEQVMRDMRINRIFEGSTEIMHLLIAREAVDQHLEVAGEILEGDGDLQGEGRLGRRGRRSSTRAGCRSSRSARASGPAPSTSSARSPGTSATPSARSRKLARSTFYAMSRWQARLEKQAGRARAGSSTSAPSCSRSPRPRSTRRRCAQEHPERGDEAVELADLFCRQARRRVDALFGELFSNDDDANYALAQQVLEGRHTWIEEGIADPSGDGPMIAGQPTEVSRTRVSGNTPR